MSARQCFLADADFATDLGEKRPFLPDARVGCSW
jgi:hypothetical protein